MKKVYFHLLWANATVTPIRTRFLWKCQPLNNNIWNQYSSPPPFATVALSHALVAVVSSRIFRLSSKYSLSAPVRGYPITGRAHVKFSLRPSSWPRSGCKRNLIGYRNWLCVHLQRTGGNSVDFGSLGLEAQNREYLLPPKDQSLNKCSNQEPDAVSREANSIANCILPGQYQTSWEIKMSFWVNY